MTTAAAVRERPILFSGPMVRAILDGRKTQTRRVVKPQPTSEATPVFGSLYLGPDVENEPTPYLVWQDDPQAYFKLPCPFGVPGDLLYVRETAELQFIAGDYWVCYEADRDGDVIEDPDDFTLAWIEKAKWKTAEPGVSVTPRRPGMLVPKSLSRIWLRVTGVRVERVRDITEEDAVAEGMTQRGHWWDAGPNWEGDGVGENAVDAFSVLWNLLNGPRGYGWDVNPWVFVIQFERVVR